MPTVHRADEVVDRAVRLVRAFRSHDLLVLAVRVAFSPDGRDILRRRTAASGPVVPSGPDWAELRPEPEIGDADLRIVKRSWNAFYGTELDLQLRRRRISGIVLAGISTSIGVESTARAADERAYELTVVTDAVTDRVAGAHANSLEVIFPKIAELATTDEVIAALDR
jgi:nicotinamidase-related amidase